MRRALYLLIPLAFILAVIAPGCYTIVMHPSEEGGYHAEQTSDCVRCHTDYEEYPYGYYYSPYPSYWWNHSDYAYYYAYPWWWSHYDYPYQNHEYEPTATSGRDTKFGRRELTSEPAAPPYSDSRSRGWDDHKLEPGIFDIPGTYQTIEPSTTTSRTQPSTTDTETQTPAETPAKIERTSRNDTKTENSDSVNQDNSSRDQRSKDQQSDDSKKKKTRRGGDGS